MVLKFEILTYSKYSIKAANHTPRSALMTKKTKEEEECGFNISFAQLFRLHLLHVNTAPC